MGCIYSHRRICSQSGRINVYTRNPSLVPLDHRNSLDVTPKSTRPVTSLTPTVLRTTTLLTKPTPPRQPSPSHLRTPHAEGRRKLTTAPHDTHTKPNNSRTPCDRNPSLSAPRTKSEPVEERPSSRRRRRSACVFVWRGGRRRMLMLRRLCEGLLGVGGGVVGRD